MSSSEETMEPSTSENLATGEHLVAGGNDKLLVANGNEKRSDEDKEMVASSTTNEADVQTVSNGTGEHIGRSESANEVNQMNGTEKNGNVENETITHQNSVLNVLRITDLSRRVNEKHLTEIFSIYGKVLESSILTTRNVNSRAANVGFVSYEAPSEALNGLDHMDKGEIDGRVVTIKAIKASDKLAEEKAMEENEVESRISTRQTRRDIESGGRRQPIVNQTELFQRDRKVRHGKVFQNSSNYYQKDSNSRPSTQQRLRGQDGGNTRSAERNRGRRGGTTARSRGRPRRVRALQTENGIKRSSSRTGNNEMMGRGRTCYEQASSRRSGTTRGRSRARSSRSYSSRSYSSSSSSEDSRRRRSRSRGRRRARRSRSSSSSSSSSSSGSSRSGSVSYRRRSSRYRRRNSRSRSSSSSSDGRSSRSRSRRRRSSRRTRSS